MKKIVVVTGATRGLGYAITKQCVVDGYKVIAIGRRISDALAELLRDHSDQVIFEPYDFFDVTGIHDFATSITRKHGRL